MWLRLALIALTYALVRRSRLIPDSLDHLFNRHGGPRCGHRLCNGPCLAQGTDMARLTLADWPTLKSFAEELQACNDIETAALENLTIATERYHVAKGAYERARTETKEARQALNKAMGEACGAVIDEEPPGTSITVTFG
jgi:hypothetical protein